ncbi:MAG: S-methyl-5'-thioadenosine phosphorylase [Thermoanaerobaculia bacterium]|nr:S-methyl-5'-thioadenosine phosphorylase [Thermoanaerobaculia bacterium]
MTAEARVGVIGGTGLYAMDALEVREERRLDTAFGAPSDAYVLGELAGVPVAFLPRHGRGHRLLPSELNYRANILGFKMLGVTQLLSVSAVGSMKEELAPASVVLPDQFYDRTRHRPDTFFGNGLVAHVSIAEPTCPGLAALGSEVLGGQGVPHQLGGTYVCMEGPQFSTRAESETYRSRGVDVIGMTQIQEARLAREAEMCFLCLAMVTDYDCWKADEEAVSVEQVLAILHRNTEMAQRLLVELIPAVAARDEAAASCGCRDALATALVTDFSLVPDETLAALDPLIARYR